MKRERRVVPDDRRESIQVGRQQRTTVALVVQVGHGAHEAFLEVVGVVLRHIENQSERESSKTTESKFGSRAEITDG